MFPSARRILWPGRFFCPVKPVKEDIAMPDPRRPRGCASALLGVLLCQALAYLLYHSLAGGTLFSPDPYDSYTLQACNWLQGRNYIAHGEGYAWLELAICNGRYYQSFPPVPALVLLPWAAVFGMNVPSNLIIAGVGLLTAAGVFGCFWQRRFAPLTAAFFAVLVGLGSNAFWLCTGGHVWFMAQMLGLCFAVWGVFFALRGRYALPSACFALAVGCRPFYALTALLWLGVLCRRIVRRQSRAASLLPALAPLALIGSGMAAYNLVRFGSPLEFGHAYLPEFRAAEYGQFNLHYLGENLLNLLRPVTLDAAGQLHFPIFNGFLPFAANPLFALWAALAIAAVYKHKKKKGGPPAPKPASADFPFPQNGFALLAAALIVLLVTATHRTMGGWQFGARYTVDLFVYPLLWLLGGGAGRSYRPAAPALTLCGMAVLFNLYGAVYMLFLS